MVAVRPTDRPSERTYNGGRQIDICFEKRDDFGTALRCSNHQDIFGVTQYRVIEQDAKEHECEGTQFLSFGFGWDDRLEAC